MSFFEGRFGKEMVEALHVAVKSDGMRPMFAVAPQFAKAVCLGRLTGEVAAPMSANPHLMTRPAC